MEEMFLNGYCLEFAIELNKLNPNLKLALIGANYYDKDFDEEVFEAAHAVLVDENNLDYFIDVKGKRTLNDIAPLFNNKIISDTYINLIEGGIEEAESYLGEINTEALNKSKEFLEQHQDIFNDINKSIQKEKNNNEIIKDLKCKSIEAKIINTMIKKGVSKLYIYEKYNEHYKKNIDVMKNNSIFMEDFMKDITNSSILDIKSKFENFIDTAINIKNKQMVNRFKKSLSGYKNLINKNTEEKLLDLAEINMTLNYFKENVANKIKSIKSTENLNYILDKQLEKLKEWSFNYQLHNINKENTTIISQKDNKILFEVHDFEASQKLGSSAWCITKEIESFDRYREDLERIYFCYDLSKDVEDNEHQTAYIVNSQGEVTSGYYVNDDFMEKEKYSIFNEYFDKYSEEDFNKRLEQENYDLTKKFFVSLMHGYKNITNNIKEYENLSINESTLIDFLDKNNIKATNELISEHKDIILENNDDLVEAILNQVEKKLFTEFSNEIMLTISKDSDYVFAAQESNYFKSLLSNLSFLDNKPEEIFSNIRSVIDFSINDSLKNSKYLNSDIINILNKQNDADEIKASIKEDPDLCFHLLNGHQIESFFSYLDFKKEDEALIRILQKYIENNNKNNDINILLLNSFSKIVDNNSNDIISINLKNAILKKPRDMLSKKNQLEEYNVTFTKEESLDIFSVFVFDKKFKELDKEDIEDLTYDVEKFNISTIFKKRVFDNKFIDQSSLNDFVNYIQNFKNKTEIKNLEEFENNLNNIKSYQRKTKIKLKQTLK